MICKECGAYNPDHATYCKVCAANLKEDVSEAVTADAVDESRPTRHFVRPSWTVPNYVKAESEPKPVRPEKKAPVREPEPEPAEEIVEAVEEDLPEQEAFTPTVPVSLMEESDEETSYRENPVESEPEETEPEAEDSDEEEFIPAPTYKRPSHTSRKASRIIEEDEEEEPEPDYDEEEPDGREEDYDYDESEEDDSYEYEPTPPKRKNNGKGNGPLFWILLSAIIVVILCIIVAGVLMFMQSSGKTLNCAGLAQTSKAQTNQSTNEPAGTQQNTGDSGSVTGNTAEDPDRVTIEEVLNDKGEECIKYHFQVPGKSHVTLVLPNADDRTWPNDNDRAVPFEILVPKSVYNPHEPLTESSYTVHPEIYITDAAGQTKSLEVPTFTLNFPTLSISLEQPVANENGVIMADKDNLVKITGHVDDFDVQVTMNGTPITVYEGGLFLADYTVTSDSTETITLQAQKKDWVSAETTISVEPYVYTPDKMVLTVASNPLVDLKADASGKLTVRGTTLPNATLTAESDNPSKVVCGSVTVDGEGNFSFNVTMDSSFYGVSHIKINAEKEDAESGSTSCMVFRTYTDNKKFVAGYKKNYKEIGSSLAVSALLANQSTYASNDYGFRVRAKVAEVIQGEDGYSYVRMTLLGSGEVIYVINLSEKWTPGNNINGDYRLYGNFLGTYQETGSALFAATLAYNNKK